VGQRRSECRRPHSAAAANNADHRTGHRGRLARIRASRARQGGPVDNDQTWGRRARRNR
jgi:hypothetical protein